jgi:hypothetical protein
MPGNGRICEFGLSNDELIVGDPEDVADSDSFPDDTTPVHGNAVEAMQILHDPAASDPMQETVMGRDTVQRKNDVAAWASTNDQAVFVQDKAPGPVGRFQPCRSSISGSDPLDHQGCPQRHCAKRRSSRDKAKQVGRGAGEPRNNSSTQGEGDKNEKQTAQGELDRSISENHNGLIRDHRKPI